MMLLCGCGQKTTGDPHVLTGNSKVPLGEKSKEWNMLLLFFFFFLKQCVYLCVHVSVCDMHTIKYLHMHRTCLEGKT